MAWRCKVCGKGPRAGKTVSHSHKSSNRRFLPNLHKARMIIGGRVQSQLVCTRCLRSNKVSKAGPRLAAA